MYCCREYESEGITRSISGHEPGMSTLISCPRPAQVVERGGCPAGGQSWTPGSNPGRSYHFGSRPERARQLRSAPRSLVAAPKQGRYLPPPIHSASMQTTLNCLGQPARAVHQGRYVAGDLARMRHRPWGALATQALRPRIAQSDLTIQ